MKCVCQSAHRLQNPVKDLEAGKVTGIMHGIRVELAFCKACEIVTGNRNCGGPRWHSG